MAPAQVSLCLVAGGMAAMPSIRGRLHELFGPERVLVPDNSATLVSQGAAWIAHDSQRLVLAKQIELEMARGSRLPLLRAGTAMPSDGEVRRDRFHLFCTDPDRRRREVLDRRARLIWPSSPRRATRGPRWAWSPSRSTRPRHHLWSDSNSMWRWTTTSSSPLAPCPASVGTSPGRRTSILSSALGCREVLILEPIEVADTESSAPTGGLVVRANVADRKDASLVPGEVLYEHNPRAFARMPGPDRATEEQLTEHLYYKPCAVCKRQWGDPACRCASVA